MGQLLDHQLNAGWHEHIAEPETWKKAAKIPDKQLWDVKNQMRSAMIDYVRGRLEDRQVEVYTRSATGRDLSTVLDPNALTIGFARRFATYKRATLLFRDRERVLRLFSDPERPLQMVLGGKAHPKDMPGKELIRRIYAFIKELGLEDRIVFIEDYDMAVARYMVQGCDIWLNTPRRPLEASGTSGMKAAINGTLNLSILDGWFPEGYNGSNAFAFGDDREFADTEHQDEFESRQLYHLLEQEVIPKFYNRNKRGLPTEWIAMQREALRTLAAAFSADRMVGEYAERFYLPSSDRYLALRANGARAIHELMGWMNHARSNWSDVKILEVQADNVEHLHVGEHATVQARLYLGALSPSDVLVEAWHGGLDPENMIIDGHATPLSAEGTQDGYVIYSGAITLDQARRTGVTVRVIPWRPELADKFALNQVTWAHSDVEEHQEY
jgi:starch phosphorylase